LQDVTVGYGYRIWQVLPWILSLLILGGWVFAHHPPAPGRDAPPFNSIVYTADLLLPVIGFGQSDDFTPGGSTRFLAWALMVLGWALTAALVAGLTRIVDRG
jgi:hypothetical protein